MDFEPGEPEAPEVQMIPVFPWGPMMMPQADPDWPIGDMDDQILDPEPEIIDLDSDNEFVSVKPLRIPPMYKLVVPLGGFTLALIPEHV